MTCLMRFIMKMPFLFVKTSKTVSMSKYKSLEYTVYSSVFDTTFAHLTALMKERGVECQVSSKSKGDLISLHFPEQKVIEYSIANGLTDYPTLELRNETSLANFVELYRQNLMMEPLTNFLLQVLDSISDEEINKDLIKVRCLIQKIRGLIQRI